jgi:hypothetical protein
MPSPRRSLLAASAFLLAIALVRCALITGTGDADKSSDNPVACAGASDCEAGSRCCVSTSLTPVCSSQCPAIVDSVDAGAAQSVQVCKTNGECEGGLCLPQVCSLGSISIAIQACSAIPQCVVK